ncbi:MAG: hypothetical protein NZM25_10730 [Leptospiraceae bacterium]|nr:hypothetical protein [Leptospiraceae bacterium]MDW8305903.1 hypothetical protein [Leptospiraceae bacterium]
MKKRGRYTLSLHKKPGERAHLDLFLDIGEEKLAHLFLPLVERRRSPSCIFYPGVPHRRVYLEKEGNLANLGKLRIVSQGTFHIKEGLAIDKPVKVRLYRRGRKNGTS